MLSLEPCAHRDTSSLSRMSASTSARRTCRLIAIPSHPLCSRSIRRRPPSTTDKTEPHLPIGCAPHRPARGNRVVPRSEEHTSELQSRGHLVCRLLLEKKNRGSPSLPSHSWTK